MSKEATVENKNGEVVVETTAEVVEEPKKGFFAKVGEGVKKHGKKVLVGAGAIGLGVLAYALGKKAAGTDYGCDCDYDEEFEFVDENSDDAE